MGIANTVLIGTAIFSILFIGVNIYGFHTGKRKLIAWKFRFFDWFSLCSAAVFTSFFIYNRADKAALLSSMWTVTLFVSLILALEFSYQDTELALAPEEIEDTEWEENS